MSACSGSVNRDCARTVLRAAPLEPQPQESVAPDAFRILQSSLFKSREWRIHSMRVSTPEPVLRFVKT